MRNSRGVAWVLAVLIVFGQAVLLSGVVCAQASQCTYDRKAPSAENAGIILKSSDYDGEADRAIDTTLNHKLTLSGTFQGDFRLVKAGSDLYLRIVELGLETPLSEMIAGTVVLNSEWLDDFSNEGNPQVVIDEAHIDLTPAGIRPYAVFGKRTQPFGLFENQLLSDPLVQNAYEIKKVGITVGIQGPLGLDLSLTGYKGTELADHLFQSQLFDTTLIVRFPETIERVASWIAAGSFSPVDSSVTLTAAVVSEPGHNRRNVSMQAALGLILPILRNVSIDIEYIRALKRERYLNRADEYREGVLGITAAYSFVYRGGKSKSRGLYRARKAFTQTHPMTAAIRYEQFEDNGMASAFSTWSTKCRYSAGGRYSIYQKNEIVGYVGVELHRLTYRAPAGSAKSLQHHSDGILARLGVDF
jgi:hypothetical protein